MPLPDRRKRSIQGMINFQGQQPRVIRHTLQDGKREVHHLDIAVGSYVDVEATIEILDVDKFIADLQDAREWLKNLTWDDVAKPDR